MITIQQQLACAQRELAMRRNTYPKWVASRRMSQAKADAEIAAMEAIIQTLHKMTVLEEVSVSIRGPNEPIDWQSELKKHTARRDEIREREKQTQNQTQGKLI